MSRRHGVSTGTLYNWRKKYGGLDVSEARRLKELETENAKLKRLVAEPATLRGYPEVWLDIEACDASRKDPELACSGWQPSDHASATSDSTSCYDAKASSRITS